MTIEDSTTIDHNEAEGDDHCVTVTNPSRSEIAGPRHVRFQDINIREFNQTVGDNPSSSSGCPIRYVACIIMKYVIQQCFCPYHTC